VGFLRELLPTPLPLTTHTHVNVINSGFCSERI